MRTSRASAGFASHPRPARRCHGPCAVKGMTNPTTPARSVLPHHNLVAYQVAVEFLRAIKSANITDAKLRDEALRSAKSTCLNLAEGAGRVTRPDKARAFAIARGEAVEAIAAVEIALEMGEADSEATQHCIALAARLVALITGLLRR